MVMVNGADAADFAPSVACAVKVKIPGMEGVPEIVPLDPFSESPGGSAPPVMAHVYAGAPPVAVRVWL
jgi:hypothetical protein